jgi:hypothetical protein
MMRRIVAAVLLSLAAAGCGSAGHAAASPAAMSARAACRYLNGWQAKHGLSDNPAGRQGLAYVAAHARNRIGRDAAKMLADYRAGLYTSPNSARPRRITLFASAAWPTSSWPCR